MIFVLIKCRSVILEPMKAVVGNDNIGLKERSRFISFFILLKVFGWMVVILQCDTRSVFRVSCNA